MADKMLIDASHEEETRVVVVRGNRIEEFDFESQHKKQLRGNIYLAKVTRVEPSLQAAFVDYGGNRHGFLAFSEIHPDYYQIPLADREALLREVSDSDDDDDTDSALSQPSEASEKAAAEDESKPKPRTRRGRAKSSKGKSDDSAKAEDAKAEEAKQQIAFLGLILVTLAGSLRHPSRLRLVPLVYHMEKVGFNALPIVGLISFLIGVVLAYQGATQLQRFGAEAEDLEVEFG
ncbi:MAG: ABC transporter permease, partial [Martelella sp.]